MKTKVIDRVLITAAVIVILSPQELPYANQFLVGSLMSLWFRTSSLALSFRWDLLIVENG